MNELKLMPSAQDIEKLALGAIMLSGNEAYEVNRELLSEDLFYNGKHKVIFKAIQRLESNFDTIDMFTVSEALNQADLLDKIGGQFEIVKMTEHVNSAANLNKHLKILTEKYLQRQIIECSARMQAKAYAGEDILDTLSSFEDLNKKIDSLQNNDAKGSLLKDIVPKSMQMYEEREKLDKNGLISGVASWSEAITEHTNGWQGNNLIVVAGRAGSGKTAYALQEAKAGAKAGAKPCFFSLEMSSVSLADRLLISEAEGLDSDELEAGYATRFRKGRLTDSEKDRLTRASKQLQSIDMYIDDRPACTMEYVHRVAKQRKKEGLCGMIVIDYLQLVGAGSAKGPREQMVAEMSRKAKLIAKDLDIPVFLLAQLSRAVETRGGIKQPVLSDLRESGAIEQDADIVLFVWRPNYYIQNDLTFEETVKTHFTGIFDGTDWTKTAMIMFAKARAEGTKNILVEVNDSCTRWQDVISQEEREAIEEQEDEGFADVINNIEVNKDFEGGF